VRIHHFAKTKSLKQPGEGKILKFVQKISTFEFFYTKSSTLKKKDLGRFLTFLF